MIYVAIVLYCLVMVLATVPVNEAVKMFHKEHPPATLISPLVWSVIATAQQWRFGP